MEYFYALLCNRDHPEHLYSTLVSEGSISEAV